jgi:cobalt-precorrin 5A hydrolase
VKIAAIAFSERGMALGERLNVPLTRCKDGGLSEWTEASFKTSDALVFIGSCGIAVRAIAPRIRSKSTDPAVIVIDELGTFVISLLSGHLGGANELAARLAEQLGSIPVITTATDINGVSAVDLFAKRNGFRVENTEQIKRVSARLLSGGGAEAYITLHASDNSDGLRLVPRIVTLGIGCRKGITCDAIEQAVTRALDEADILEKAVRQVCSIDLKAAEPGLIEFCERRKLPFRTFSAEQLMSVPGEFSRSERVLAVTGADNVCERAAVLGSGGVLISRKRALDGVTTALAVEKYIVNTEK